MWGFYRFDRRNAYLVDFQNAGASKVPKSRMMSLSLKYRIILSMLVVFHLAAVFIGPWSMRPYDSAFSSALAQAWLPYLRAASLDNGYRFFAPEPGPSHLVRYELAMPDGSAVEGVFPDLSEHQPRLLYHRHFMLSEFLNTLDNPAFENPDLETSPPAPELADLARWKRLHGELIQSVARHLLVTSAAEEITLYLRRHNIPLPEEVARGVALDDSRWIEEKLLGSFSREELE